MKEKACHTSPEILLQPAYLWPFQLLPGCPHRIQMGRTWQAERQCQYSQGLISLQPTHWCKRKLNSCSLPFLGTHFLTSHYAFLHLHALGNREQKALTGKTNLNRSWKRFCFQGAARIGLLSQGSWTGSQRDPTAQLTPRYLANRTDMEMTQARCRS